MITGSPEPNEGWYSNYCHLFQENKTQLQIERFFPADLSDLYHTPHYDPCITIAQFYGGNPSDYTLLGVVKLEDEKSA